LTHELADDDLQKFDLSIPKKALGHTNEARIMGSSMRM
jgi:hypothetical protein